MTHPEQKDSQLGKGYSYLMAIAFTFLIAWQSVDIRFTTDSKQQFQFSIASRELDSRLFVAGVGLIATILGLPTDAIALAIGSFLSKGRK
jgi:hypothetical protein